jgi:LysM repeat protein
VKRQTAPLRNEVFRPPGACLPAPVANANMEAMKTWATMAFVLAAFLSTATLAQTPGEKSTETQLEALTRKIDEQNAKIDALSQQILKIEQQLSKPGVVIGEATPAAVASATPSVEQARATGSTHTVTRGETLTSIAKMHKVGVEELQKFNHIENDRKLQIGQTIMIPNSGSAAPSVSPGSSPLPND